MRWHHFKLLFFILIAFQFLIYYFISNYLNSINKNVQNDRVSNLDCQSKIKLYLKKPSIVNYESYCSRYAGINSQPTLHKTMRLSRNILEDLKKFNLSAEIQYNHVKVCGSLCRNLASPFFFIYHFMCYCIENLKFSVVNKKFEISNISVYETKAFPIQYSSYKLGLTDDDKNKISIVFLLMLSGRDIIQVRQLLLRIYQPSNFYFIHIDKRNVFLRRHLIKLQQDYSNVFIFQWSMSTIWGGTSLLRAYMKAMKDIISRNLKWDFLINLSESDYPIRSNKELVKFLRSNKNMNFVKSSGQSVDKFIKKQGLNKAFVECEEHLYLVGDRYLPNNLIVDGGSDWFVLTQKFVSYIVSTQDNLVGNLVAFFENSLLPAETFFHMVLQNSKFCMSVVNTNLRFTNWNRRRGCRCQHSSVIGWCGCSPSVLRNNSFNRLQNIIKHDPSIFFSRKFDMSIDKSIFNTIDNNNLNVYQNSHCHHMMSHYLNFHSGDQNGDLYRPLAGLLFTKFHSQYSGNNYCVPTSLVYNAIDLFMGINQNSDDKVNNVKQVVLYYSYGDFGFEAFFLYAGKAGFIKKYPTKFSNSNPPFELSSFTVGQDYDLKENIFRTPPFLMVSNKSLTLQIEIQTRRKLKIICYIVFIDPLKKKHSFKLPNITTTLSNDNQWFDGIHKTTSWFDGFEIERPLLYGMWEVLLYFNEFRVPTMKTFFYINSNNVSTSGKSLEKFQQWKMVSYCIYRFPKNCNLDSNSLCKNCSLHELLH